MNKNKKRRYGLWVTTIGLLLSIWALLALPLPYYIHAPGGASDVSQVMTVNGQKDSQPGSYNFVYIRVQQATPLTYLLASLDDNQTIVSEREELGDSTNQEYTRISQVYMETSQNQATYQALKLAKREVTMDYLGVYVLSVSDTSTFKGILQVGDTVTSINGQEFKDTKSLITYVASLEVGSDVTVSYSENGDQKTAKGKVIRLSNGKNGIGISLTEHTQVQSKDQIEFNTAGIGGPSAGLMFTLSIYTQLQDPGLRNGRVIAGTGTIESDGSVGDIGGAAMKVISAEQSGATVFFVPNNPVSDEVKKANPDAKTNYEEALESAKRNQLKIKVVPVTKVQDAIDYLEKTKSQE
ncbi:SepM family pheromone-processing serine protease [Streptococcus sp. DD13]|uniref:SepM family pheromone-processing serine protease n=1 Tax=Streptococcus sp. DD13 TaxID=1777881 RepID=UPI0007952F32|nr:SepM family pheromone-processing serine protease [Streptococcus sp. DD13]KXT78258.1 Lon-like protease with PDZ domain [Streptococcus sp. DD13]